MAKKSKIMAAARSAASKAREARGGLVQAGATGATAYGLGYAEGRGWAGRMPGGVSLPVVLATATIVGGLAMGRKDSMAKRAVMGVAAASASVALRDIGARAGTEAAARAAAAAPGGDVSGAGSHEARLAALRREAERLEREAARLPSVAGVDDVDRELGALEREAGLVE